MENTLRKICNWAALLLLFLAITFYVTEVSLFDSEYIGFYGLAVLGLMVNLFGRQKKSIAEGPVTKFIRQFSFYGNLAIVILFFLPFYYIWGTFLFGP
ncbi:hypothetical protein [Bacillus massiliigorillae]|uniref:hypothetical protein n=1 Tax=Bacillus massiliigorillae TaxID=1243664 RepID=UPI00039F1BAB|nr:hypothetical protein [Bacillus massiliigorillae]